MIYGSVCDGIHASGLAWSDIGWHCSWRYEIDGFADAVTSHHWPDVPNLGDMTKWREHNHEPVTLLCGGTPCQSFSIAGKRGGLDDARGDLTIEFSRLAKHIRPRWLFWENVPGVLSLDGGHAFGAILAAFAGYDRPIVPPEDRWRRAGIVKPGPNGYGLAWRVLDAQFFGLAQHRPRLFVVGYFGDWRAAATVLLEPESMSRDSASRGKAREAHHTGIASSPCGNCGSGDKFGLGGGFFSSSGQISRCLTAGAHTRFDLESETLIAFSCKDYGNGVFRGVSPTLKAMSNDGSHANGGGQVAVSNGYWVRRFTPKECERVQGIPDGYTEIPWRGKPADKCPDGRRYKAIGLSWPVPVVRWIGKRIDQVDRTLSSDGFQK